MFYEKCLLLNTKSFVQNKLVGLSSSLYTFVVKTLNFNTIHLPKLLNLYIFHIILFSLEHLFCLETSSVTVTTIRLLIDKKSDTEEGHYPIIVLLCSIVNSVRLIFLNRIQAHTLYALNFH